MEIGIIGLPMSGKTTLFNAVTKGKADTDAYARGGPHMGVAKVPDPRLDALEEIFHPKRKIPAEVRYIDVGALPKGGLGGELLSHLSKSDALLHVVRAFEDERVPHIEGSIDPDRDVAMVDLELTFSDLSILEKRLQKIETSLKAAKAHEREAFFKEQALLARIKASLESEIPIREQDLTERNRGSLQAISS